MVPALGKRHIYTKLGEINLNCRFGKGENLQRNVLHRLDYLQFRVDSIRITHLPIC